MDLFKDGFNFIKYFIIRFGSNSFGFAIAWIGLFVFLLSVIFGITRHKKV